MVLFDDIYNDVRLNVLFVHKDIVKKSDSITLLKVERSDLAEALKFSQLNGKTPCEVPKSSGIKSNF